MLKHDINVSNHPPITQSAYRGNPAKRKAMEVKLKNLVENEHAVLGSSTWSSPCLLVPKSGSTDYKKVNAVMANAAHRGLH